MRSRMQTIRFAVAMVAMGKPRQTQRDKWKPSKATERYRLWADELRIRAPMRDIALITPSVVEVRANIPMPKSWTKKKMVEKVATLHDATPDWDNIGKAVCDVLFPEDKTIGAGTVRSYWTYPGEEMMTIEVRGYLL